jgi:acyl transferase domain-containing protein
VYRGSKANGQARLAFLKSHEDARRHAQELIEANDLAQLARCWVDGLEIDWGATRYAQGRRVLLPTYPFAKTRYWVPTAGPVASTGDGLADEVMGMLKDGLLTQAQARELLSV